MRIRINDGWLQEVGHSTAKLVHQSGFNPSRGLVSGIPAGLVKTDYGKCFNPSSRGLASGIVGALN